MDAAIVMKSLIFGVLDLVVMEEMVWKMIRYSFPGKMINLNRKLFYSFTYFLWSILLVEFSLGRCRRVNIGVLLTIEIPFLPLKNNLFN